MNIAVTGGSGQIGTYVCDELATYGHSVTCLDRLPPQKGSNQDIEYRQVDLNNLDSTVVAVAECDQIVHLAAIPDPYGDDGLEAVLGNNTATSYTVFEAARLSGIKRVIYGCSESSTGFGIHHVKLIPEYLPIDEDHPVWPHEAYSLSKHFGERIGAFYAKAFGMEVISLRYTWVWTKRSEEAARRIAAAAQSGRKPDRVDGFGAYIAVRDVARACAKSAEFRFSDTRTVPFESVFLAARDNALAIPTLELVQAYCDCLPPIRDPEYFEKNRFASVFDIRKAKRLLGWEPEFGCHTIDTMEF